MSNGGQVWGEFGNSFPFPLVECEIGLSLVSRLLVTSEWNAAPRWPLNPAVVSARFVVTPRGGKCREMRKTRLENWGSVTKESLGILESPTAAVSLWAHVSVGGCAVCVPALHPAPPGGGPSPDGASRGSDFGPSAPSESSLSPRPSCSPRSHSPRRFACWGQPSGELLVEPRLAPRRASGVPSGEEPPHASGPCPRRLVVKLPGQG